MAVGGDDANATGDEFGAPVVLGDFDDGGGRLRFRMESRSGFSLEGESITDPILASLSWQTTTPLRWMRSATGCAYSLAPDCRRSVRMGVMDAPDRMVSHAASMALHIRST